MGSYWGKLLVGIGTAIVLAGLVLIIIDKAGLHFGRLSWDICIKRKNFVFYFPLGTSLLISLILTLLFSFFSRR